MEDLFCKLTAVEIDHGKLGTGRWLVQPSMAVGMTSGGASAPRTSGSSVGRSSSSKCQIGTGGSGVATKQRCCGSAMAARVWANFVRDRGLFRGVLAPNRRQQKS
jgi:hypothetical protein